MWERSDVLLYPHISHTATGGQVCTILVYSSEPGRGGAPHLVYSSEPGEGGLQGPGADGHVCRREAVSYYTPTSSIRRQGGRSV